MKSLQEEIPTKTFIKIIDVSKSNAQELLSELIKEMGGLDLILISLSAFNDFCGNYKATPEQEAWQIEVDLKGFVKMAQVALQVFEQQRSGHLVGITSISALRASLYSPIYSSSKIFIQQYLESIRRRIQLKNIPICVTDIVPGWVANERYNPKYASNKYWVIGLKEAGRQIIDAINKNTKQAYVLKKWMIAVCAIKCTPDWFHHWLFSGF